MYTRYRRWGQQGVWEYVFEELIAQDIVDESDLMLDGTTVKVYQHDSRTKNGVVKPLDAVGED